MWKKILFLVLVAGGAAALLIGNRVKHAAPVQVERGTFIAATPAAIIAELAHLQNWVAWADDKDDPSIRRTYGGPAGRPGASYYWSSTDPGRPLEGRLTIIAIRPDGVELELEHVSPKPALTDYTFQVTDEGTGSRVVWTASGDVDDFMGKALGNTGGRHLQLDSEVQNGLAALKAVVEAQENVQAYRVERSTVIAAPDVFVLAEIMDFREWSKWFPREQLDPELKRVFSGSDAQPGSTYFWSGNDQVGEGRVTMISSSAEKVELEVELDRPVDSMVSDLVFTLARDGASTNVVWTVSGEKDPSGKAFTVLGSSPETLGSEMEEGLENLKAIAEGAIPRKAGSAPAKVARHKKPLLEIVVDSIVLRRAN
jgi:hypothetical protein